jgi:hypothetical protein
MLASSEPAGVEQLRAELQRELLLGLVDLADGFDRALAHVDGSPEAVTSCSGPRGCGWRNRPEILAVCRSGSRHQALNVNGIRATGVSRIEQRGQAGPDSVESRFIPRV